MFSFTIGSVFLVIAYIIVFLKKIVSHVLYDVYYMMAVINMADKHLHQVLFFFIVLCGLHSTYMSIFDIHFAKYLWYLVYIFIFSLKWWEGLTFRSNKTLPIRICFTKFLIFISFFLYWFNLWMHGAFALRN